MMDDDDDAGGGRANVQRMKEHARSAVHTNTLKVYLRERESEKSTMFW